MVDNGSYSYPWRPRSGWSPWARTASATRSTEHLTYILDPDGVEQWRSAVLYPVAWSAHELLLARRINTPSRSHELLVAEPAALATEEPTPLEWGITNGGETLINAAWSPESDRLAILVWEDNSARLDVRDRQGAVLGSVAPPDTRTRSVTWSADGRFVMFPGAGNVVWFYDTRDDLLHQLQLDSEVGSVPTHH